MARLDISVHHQIGRPTAEVRQQFGDVVHHQNAMPHKGVRFEVIEDTGDRCRYRQRTSVGPLRLTQIIELERTDAGPLVNTITKGPFSGGTISFDIAPGARPSTSVVTARIDAEVRGPQALLLPLLRKNVRAALTRALAEDQSILESGAYAAEALRR